MPRALKTPALNRDIQFGPHRYRYHLRPPADDNWAELTRILTDLEADRFALVTEQRRPRGHPRGHPRLPCLGRDPQADPDRRPRRRKG